VGAAGPEDPRDALLSITRLEGLARCPWQAFLERVLGLDPPPDALAELPDASPLLLGNIVHAVLEELARDAGAAVGVSIEVAQQHPPVRLVWPAADELERRLLAAAERAAREEGIVLRGFAVHLARRARPLLERFRALEWGDGRGPLVLGAELEGRVEVANAAGAARPIRFRADRADHTEGGVVLVDYKTGAPISKLKGEAKRQEQLLAQIAKGQRLQGPAYARAASAGRYVFAKDGVEDEAAVVTIAHEDTAAGAHFDAAAHDLLTAFERGAFPPRLLNETRSGRNDACDRCGVAEACLSGESGSAQHLAAWLTEHQEEPEQVGGAANAALTVLLRVEKK
jgi:RecB family exonuclease